MSNMVIRNVLLISYCCANVARSQNVDNKAQGNSKWPLDPFLGTYDMDLANAIGMVEFSHGLLGKRSVGKRENNSTGLYRTLITRWRTLLSYNSNVLCAYDGAPEDAVRAGERQTFGKTSDGSKYIQTVSRPGLHDSNLDDTYHFALGEEVSMNHPGITASVTFSMTNETTLLASYVYKAGTQAPVVFDVYFIFDHPDPSGFFDIVKVLHPVNMTATAPFLRVDPRSSASDTKAQPAVPTWTPQCSNFVPIVLGPGSQMTLSITLPRHGGGANV